MKSGFASPWAASPSTLRRDPTTTEQTTGIPCGPFDVKMWNEMFYRLTLLDAELQSILSAAGITPNEADTAQVLKALKGSIVSIVPVFTSGSVTVPTGATQVLVEAWGATGAGGAGTVTGAAGSGAGGAGAAAGLYPVTAGSTLSPVIGAGGTHVTNANGNSGGTTSIAIGASTISITGSGGGLYSAGGGQTTTGAAGVATGGNLYNKTGGLSGQGNSISSIGFSGQGGTAPFGGAGCAGSTGSGGPGGFPGGGASGGANAGQGGDGVAGYFKFTFLR
jgi:hypothetical protein